MMQVSVVIASYNHAPYLRACIESALEQTSPPSEVIVVDDGSTDGSREIIESFGASIKPILQENRGTYSALNTGFARASGDWIAIHNSDDVWESQKLSQQIELAGSSPEPGLIHTGYACIDEHGEVYSTLPHNANLPDYHGPPITEMLPLMLRSMPVIISSTLISRKAWERTGSFDERYHGMGDWDLCLRISREFQFGFVDAPLTQVRKHRTNASTDASRIPANWTQQDWRYLGYETMMSSANHLYQSALEGKIQRNEAAFALACLGYIHQRSGSAALSRQSLILAAKLQPMRLQTYLRYATSFLPRSIRQKLS